jgi:glycosyltransferase involved in cell wall biosynthesis
LDILLVSKPLVPPWNDSGKNWARDVATYASSEVVRHRVLVPRGGARRWEAIPNVWAEEVYGGPTGFAPPVLDLARVFLRLVRKRGCDAVHYCFAPNPRSCRMGRAAMVRRRQPSVHAVLSVPAKFDGIDRMLFSERVVAVSRSTADKLVAAGVRGVELVPAAIPLPVGGGGVIAAADGPPQVVFPGDYEFSRGADIFALAVERMWREVDAQFVFACRTKTPDALEREAALRARLAEPVAAGRVQFVGEVSDIFGLLARAHVVVFPAESTYAKMDVPLVVLEAMALGTPVILADVAPLRECLGDDPAGAGGLLVPALDPGALANAINEMLADPDGAAERGALAAAHVRQHRDAAVVCRRYLEIYDELV